MATNREEKQSRLGPHTSGLAIVAAICGLTSLLIGRPIGVTVLDGVLHLALGGTAVSLGLAARREIKARPFIKGAGLAVTGIVTGAVGPTFAMLYLVGQISGYDLLAEVFRLIGDILLAGVGVLCLIGVILWLYRWFGPIFFDDD